MAKWPKQKLNLLTQVGTGHALVAYHIGKWTQIEPTCDLCLEEEETVEHLYHSCPALERARYEMQLLHSEDSIGNNLVRFFSLPTLRALFQSRSDICGEEAN